MAIICNLVRYTSCSKLHTGGVEDVKETVKKMKYTSTEKKTSSFVHIRQTLKHILLKYSIVDQDLIIDIPTCARDKLTVITSLTMNKLTVITSFAHRLRELRCESKQPTAQSFNMPPNRRWRY